MAKKMATKTANRLTTVSTAMLPQEAIKIKEIAQAKGLTISELFREGMQWYLANQDKLAVDSRETALEKRIRKMEERLAALQARTAIDVGIVYHLIWRNMDKDKRDDEIAWAYHKSVERLKKRLSGESAAIKELIKDDQDSSKT